MAAFGMPGIAAIAAGMIFALNGYMFSLQFNYTLLATAAWMPMCLFLTKKVNSGVSFRNYKFVAASAACFFLLLTAGRPEVSEPAVFVFVCYIAISALAGIKDKREPKNQIVREALLRLLPIVIGGLLAAPAILPVLEWKGLSSRAAALQPSEIFLWSANWYDVLCLILSQPLGDVSILGSKFLNVVASRPGHIPYLDSAYVGPIAATLALWGALDSSWRLRNVMLLLFFAGLIMALGDHTVISPAIIHVIGGLAVFRYPVKLMIFPVAAIAVLAGRGLYLALQGRPSRLTEIISWGFWLGLFFLGLEMAFYSHSGGIVSAYQYVSTAKPSALVLAEASKLIGFACMRAAIIGIVTCLAARMMWWRDLNQKNFSIIVIGGLLASMLVPAFAFSQHTTAGDFFDRPSILQRAIGKLEASDIGSANKQKPGVRYWRQLSLYFDPLTCPDSFTKKSQMVKTESFYEYGRQLLLPNTNIDAGIPSAFGYEVAEAADYREVYLTALKRSNAWTADEHDADDSMLARFCQMTASKYATTQAYDTPGKSLVKLDAKRFALLLDDKESNLRIYRPLKVNPRAYFTTAWVVAQKAQALYKITAPDLENTNFAETPILEADEDKDALTPAPAPAQSSTATNEKKAQGISEAQLVLDKPEHVSVELYAKSPGLLVLADHYYPGWQATIDSKPAKIYRINSILRGVLVSSGEHLIEFQYKPQSLYLGYLLAILGLVLLGAIGMFIKLNLGKVKNAKLIDSEPS